VEIRSFNSSGVTASLFLFTIRLYSCYSVLVAGCWLLVSGNN
jgi:hypothetical protein